MKRGTLEPKISTCFTADTSFDAAKHGDRERAHRWAPTCGPLYSMRHQIRVSQITLMHWCVMVGQIRHESFLPRDQAIERATALAAREGFRTLGIYDLYGQLLEEVRI